MILTLREAARAGDLGGKAAALAELDRAGVAIPRAWVVPRSAFRAFLLENQIGEDALAPEASVLLGRMPVPLACPAPCVAVRSSGHDEDGGATSNAGRYETVLGVAPDEFEAAVRKVWASWLLQRRPGQPLDGMTVLVQEMVDARVAGVLFTTNPVTGSWAEMVVEAVWGLGAPLVSGSVVPDRYVLTRGRGLGARETPTVAHQEIQEQGTEVVIDHRKLVTRATASPLARKLLQEDLVILAMLGLVVERARGTPQDIEWAVDRAGAFHILQARPITTQRRLPRGDATLWTRRFIGERFPDGVTPLTWSIVGPTLDHFIAYPETSRRFLGGEPALRVLNGHPYVNVTVFRHLAFKFPGAAPPRFMLDFFPPEEEAAWVSRRAAAPDVAVYASIFRTTFAEQRWQRFRWNPATNVRAWDTFRSALDAHLRTLATASLPGVLRSVSHLLREYIKIHVTSLLFANMGWELLAPTLSDKDRAVLLRPAGASITRRVDAALGDVGRGCLSIDEFLAAHGHRSRASWEIWALHLAEDVPGTWALARTMAATQPPGIHAALDAEAAETAAAIAALPPLRRRLTHLASEYLRLREEQRYHLDRIFWAAKSRLVALAPTLPLAADNVAWLTASELLDLPADADRRAEQRKALRPSSEPPDFLRGDEPLPPPPSGRRLQGVGVSPGAARGTARVLRTLEDGLTLRPGEILVTRSTDPAWSPVLARAGGLVLEMGSQLSHGAVIAREYAVPAVANIASATHYIADGAEVQIDGRTGAVWILG